MKAKLNNQILNAIKNLKNDEATRRQKLRALSIIFEYRDLVTQANIDLAKKVKSELLRGKTSLPKSKSPTLPCPERAAKSNSLAYGPGQAEVSNSLPSAPANIFDPGQDLTTNGESSQMSPPQLDSEKTRQNWMLGIVTRLMIWKIIKILFFTVLYILSTLLVTKLLEIFEIFQFSFPTLFNIYQSMKEWFHSFLDKLPVSQPQSQQSSPDFKSIDDHLGAPSG